MAAIGAAANGGAHRIDRQAQQFMMRGFDRHGSSCSPCCRNHGDRKTLRQIMLFD
jgi:hypothetical protein